MCLPDFNHNRNCLQTKPGNKLKISSNMKRTEFIINKGNCCLKRPGPWLNLLLESHPLIKSYWFCNGEQMMIKVYQHPVLLFRSLILHWVFLHLTESPSKNNNNNVYINNMTMRHILYSGTIGHSSEKPFIGYFHAHTEFIQHRALQDRFIPGVEVTFKPHLNLWLPSPSG